MMTVPRDLALKLYENLLGDTSRVIPALTFFFYPFCFLVFKSKPETSLMLGRHCEPLHLWL